MRRMTDEELKMLYEVRPHVDKYGNLKKDAPKEIKETLKKLLLSSADNVCY